MRVTYFEIAVFVEDFNLILNSNTLFAVESVNAIDGDILHFPDSKEGL